MAPSEYLKTAFIDAGYSTTYIPNNIELAKYKFQKRSDDTIRLLWVRSFSKIYNPGLAIKVQKQLEEKGYVAELCMVGPDSDGSLDEVKSLAITLKTNTIFTGKMKKSDWIERSKDYNIFINTTNFDNTPVSVIEAMALGLPIVSTDVGGMPFLIDDGKEGLLVPPNNIGSMVKAILKLKENDELRNECVSAARYKVEQFDWVKVKNLWNILLG